MSSSSPVSKRGNLSSDVPPLLSMSPFTHNLNYSPTTFVLFYVSYLSLCTCIL